MQIANMLPKMPKVPTCTIMLMLTLIFGGQGRRKSKTGRQKCLWEWSWSRWWRWLLRRWNYQGNTESLHYPLKCFKSNRVLRNNKTFEIGSWETLETCLKTVSWHKRRFSVAEPLMSNVSKGTLHSYPCLLLEIFYIPFVLFPNMMERKLYLLW